MTTLKKMNRNTKEIVCHEGKKNNGTPTFLSKLYQILETSEYNEIIQWGDNGRTFVVKNLNEFTENVLSKFYKHNNYSSFVRQLNMYDFHKKRNNNSQNIFYHKNFIQGQKHLIKTIKRKNVSKSGGLTNTNNDVEDEEALMEFCCKELSSSKRVSKSTIKMGLSYLRKTINEINQKQQKLEAKVGALGSQNEEFIIQNQQMLEELMNKESAENKSKSIACSEDLGSQNFKHPELLAPLHSEIKTKAYNDGGMTSKSNYIKLDNQSDFFKSFLEKYMESGKFNPKCLGKIDIPMLMDSPENVTNPNANGDCSPNVPNSSILQPEKATNNIANCNNMSNANNSRLEMEDDKSVLFKCSPNPFLEDYSFNHSNSLEHSCENFPIPRLINENNKDNEDNKNNIVISRPCSLDLNELFRNHSEEDGGQKEKFPNMWLEDSVFSVSSDHNYYSKHNANTQRKSYLQN